MPDGHRKARPLFEPAIVRRAIVRSFWKLDPRHQVKNPVMFVAQIGSVLPTGLFVQALVGQGEAPAGFILAVSLWLWFTVGFANFAEAMAEGRGAAQAEDLRRQRRETSAKRLDRPPDKGFVPARARTRTVRSSELHKDDVVLVEAGEFIPSDGEVVEGVASVDESAITGESAPVIRESGGDRTAGTGGTRAPPASVVARMTPHPGATSLSRTRA